MKPDAMESPYYLNSVGNALRVLDELSGHEAMTAAEVGKALGIGKATTFRLLYTLEVCGWVEKHSDLRYSLSAKFIEYGSLVLGRKDLVSVARPVLDRLRDQTKLSSHLVVLDPEDGWITFLYKAASRTGLQSASTAGSRMVAYRCGTGKVLLAALDAVTLGHLAGSYSYQRFTENTILSAEALLRELQEVRRDGFAEDREESELGLTCLAMPIHDASGKTCAAISISGATPVVNTDREKRLQQLREAAREISQELGYFA